MKKIAFALVLMAAAPAYAGLSTYYCAENANPGRESLMRRAVRIIETRELPRGNFDHRKLVTVQLIRALSFSKSVYKEFVAIATSEDVLYKIDALEAQNFMFHTYLDEPGAWVTSKDSGGTPSKMAFTCELDQ